MDSPVSLNKCFELQLSEVEMLNSMYPNSDEFIISLPYVLADMNKYLSEDSNNVPSQLDFSLNLTIPDIKDKLEVNVCLPHEYPFSKPEISARSVSLDRSQQRDLNSSIMGFLQTLEPGDLCILSLINWLMENAGKFFSLSRQANTEEIESKKDNSSEPLCRMWIYSHHIYNKFKRRDIVDSANDMKLTGFSLPGKPGFICIEGFKRDCNDFLQSLKKMSWKKISLVKEELKESKKVDLTNFRKFENFSEISFQVRRGPAKEYHMDMGQFLKYLGEHDCAYAFHDLFGMEGQTSAEK